METNEHVDVKGKGKLRRKATRNVEIGWMDNQKQVRKRHGGGTRRVDIPRSYGREDLMMVAKGVFVPNGQSTKGPRGFRT